MESLQHEIVAVNQQRGCYMEDNSEALKLIMAARILLANLDMKGSNYEFIHLTEEMDILLKLAISRLTIDQDNVLHGTLD